MSCNEKLKPVIMRIVLTVSFLMLFFLTGINAQENAKAATFTLSGYVKDTTSGEDLIGASVAVSESSTGTTTNIYGFYSLSLPAGNYQIAISYIGYTTKVIEVDLSKNVEQNFELSTVSSQIEEIVVKANKEDVMMQDAGVGTTKINVEKLENQSFLTSQQLRIVN